jgi:hypothetical protein
VGTEDEFLMMRYECVCDLVVIIESEAVKTCQGRPSNGSTGTHAFKNT